MPKKTITVPPKETHVVDGREYRAGETYTADLPAVKGKKKSTPSTKGGANEQLSAE